MFRPARHALLSPAVLLGLMTACSAPDPAREEAAWRELQVERLRRMYVAELEEWDRAVIEGLAAEAAEEPMVEEPVAQEPPPPAQEPRHIDDREPPAAQDPTPVPPGMRRFGPPLDEGHRIQLRGGVGTVRVALGSSGPRDRESAVFAELGIAPAAHRPFGGGFDLSGFLTGDDLFQGQSTTGARGAGPADAFAWSVDAFPHAAWQPALGDRWRAAIKAGPFLSFTTLDHRDVEVRRSWFDGGGRLVFEPEWVFSRTDGLDLSLFGRGAFDVGGTRFREDVQDGEFTDTAERWAGEAGGGLRLSADGMSAELSYRFRHAETGDLFSRQLGRLSSVDFETQALFLGLSTRF